MPPLGWTRTNQTKPAPRPADLSDSTKTRDPAVSPQPEFSSLTSEAKQGEQPKSSSSQEESARIQQLTLQNEGSMRTQRSHEGEASQSCKDTQRYHA
jgi:hypothetical protein